MGEGGRERTTFERVYDRLGKIWSVPTTWFYENVAEPSQAKHKIPYYHRRFRRVPDIDECDVGDNVCFWEANEQFKRDRLVDNNIVEILRQRMTDCQVFYGWDDRDKFCERQKKDYEDAAVNWFTKYGDLGAKGNVIDAYMKQKHRMIWEQRYGPVGTGMHRLKAGEDSDSE